MKGERRTVEKRENQLAELGKLILAGAEKRPQCYDEYFKDGGSCALGAAYEALTGEVNYSLAEVQGVLKDAFPILQRGGPDCPLCGEGGTLLWLLVHLNDSHRWTRERIAALLLLGPSKA